MTKCLGILVDSMFSRSPLHKDYTVERLQTWYHFTPPTSWRGKDIKDNFEIYIN